MNVLVGLALLCLAALAEKDWGDTSVNDDITWDEKDQKTVDPRTERDTYFDDYTQEATFVLHDYEGGILYPRKQFNMWNTMGHAIHCRDSLVEGGEPLLHDSHCIEMLSKAYERMADYPDIPYRICRTIYGLKPPDAVQPPLGNATLENNMRLVEQYLQETNNRVYGRDIRHLTRLIADAHLLREERLWHDGKASTVELLFHAQSDWDEVMVDQAIFALKCAEFEDLDVYRTVLEDTWAVP